MNWILVLSVATGILAAIGSSWALVVLFQDAPASVAPRTLFALALAIICGLCVVEAIYLQSTPLQAGMMLLAAGHTIMRMRMEGRRHR